MESHLQYPGLKKTNEQEFLKTLVFILKALWGRNMPHIEILPDLHVSRNYTAIHKVKIIEK